MTGVYLAYAIDQVTPAQEARSRDDLSRIKGWLQQFCSWIYDPGSAFRVGHNVDPGTAIREINQYALMTADVLVAYLPKGVASIGVPMEIERAQLMGKKVLIISDAPSWMLQYGSEDVAVFRSWNDAAMSWLHGALRRVPETTEGPDPYSLPVVVDEGAEAPKKAHDDDAGMDLVVSHYTVVGPGEFVDIPCGVSVALPDWSWGLITGRSSTLRKRGLMVSQGVIDAGYRGPIFAGVWNLTDKPVEVNAGERLAQLLILDNGTRLVEIKEVDKLPNGSRGTNGFGSTGV